MPPVDAAWSVNNPVFQGYVFYSCILVLKLFFMVILTGRQRFTKNVSTHNRAFTVYSAPRRVSIPPPPTPSFPSSYVGRLF